jgi:hypothetical protein
MTAPEGRAALVTGASRGIGTAVVKASLRRRRLGLAYAKRRRRRQEVPSRSRARRPSATAASTSSWRTPASGAYGPFLDLPPERLKEDDRRERGGDALRRPRDAAASHRAADFALGGGRTPEMPQLAGMMSSEDVAEVVVFVLTRPRSHRILEAAFRQMTEESWG